MRTEEKKYDVMVIGGGIAGRKRPYPWLIWIIRYCLSRKVYQLA